MDNYKSNIDFLKNTEVEVKDDFVVIDEFMRTAVKDIFACGSLVHKDSVVISIMLVDNIIRQMKGEICQTY
jgi:thioredoxin reductase